jgi:carbon-monoxide dehydrogenase medium subunit
MIDARFDYVRPASMAEALEALAADDGSRVISGGQSLLPLFKLGLAQVDRLVDVGGIAELHGISAAPDGGLVIGAATTYREILESSLVAERCPLLPEVAAEVGDLQVRNVGTVGGGLAHADPAADMPAVMLALDAWLVLRSEQGERVVAADGFFRGAFETALSPGELLVEMRVPAQPPGSGSASSQLVQPASGYPLVGVVAVVSRSGSGAGVARVAVTGVGEAPYRATATEAALLAGGTDPSAVAAAAAVVTEGQVVRADLHADADYRAAMAVVHARRAITAALERAA